MKNLKQKCRVALITCAPFPVGNVSTMRFSSYLKALVQDDTFCYVLVYCPTRMAAHIKERSGIYKGIYYQYATDITWKKYNLINKIIFLISGLLNSLSYLNEKKINTIILYGDNPFIVNFFYWLYAKLTGKRFIGDRSELPTLDERNSKIKMLLYGLKQKMFDGMIIMTKQLMQFYSMYSNKSDFLFFLPMTIDPSRFEGLEKTEQEHSYIAVVFGTHNRDGLLESLKSFDLYCMKGGCYDIHIIGDYNNMPNKDELNQYIASSAYRNRIHILGRQPNDKVPNILYNASVLLTTPNFYVSGGFPTKLGEYMLSGVPIVATKAGEMLDYIEPDVDMLLSAPGDIECISNNILTIERNPVLAKTLSVNAKNKALNVFCANSYLADLKKFISQ